MKKKILRNFTNRERRLLNFIMVILKWYTKLHIIHNMEKDLLSPKQMLQRLPIALAQVKAGNTSENLLNEIRQIIFSLYQEKEIAKKYITI